MIAHTIDYAKFAVAYERFLTANYFEAMPCTKFDDGDANASPVFKATRKLHWEFAAPT